MSANNRFRPILFAGIWALAVTATLACASEPTLTPAPAPTAIPVAPTRAPAATPAPIATPTPTGAATVTQEKPQYGGTLRFPLSISLDAPDVAYTIQTGTRRLLYVMYGGLVEQMPDGTIGPDLARSWEFSSDGKAITFNLQKGVKFHDGTDLDAQAVKWNYDRFLDPKVGSLRGRELAPPLQRVEVVDGSTVRFHLSSPSRPFLALLTLQAGLIASPTAVQKYNSYADRNGEFGRKAIGSGPFKLQEWIPGSHFYFVRNDNYWEKGLPYLDSIRMPIIPDRQIQFAMLRTGELDLLEEMSVGDTVVAGRNPNLSVIELKGASIWFFSFRVSVKPWDNKTLRQAFGYAIDKKAIVDVIFGGRAAPAHSLIGPSTGAWFDSTVKFYDYDLKKARDKLTEAGYPKGISFTLPCRTGPIDTPMCESLQAMLAGAGINAEIQPYDNVNYSNDYAARKIHGPRSSFWSPRPDPGILLRTVHHSKGSFNNDDYGNPEVDRLLDEAEGVYDLAKAKEIYHRVEMILEEDAQMLHVAWFNVLYGVRNTVRNFVPIPDTVPRLRDLWLSK